MPWNNLKAIIFFWKQYFFWSVWQSQWKKRREFSDFFRRGCQKCNSRVQQTLWGKIILLRVVQFWHFIELWTKEKFDFGRKLYKKSVETAFSVSRGTFGQKQFFWRFYILYDKFCTLSKKNGILAERLQQRCQNCFVCVQEPIEEKCICRKCTIFPILSAFEHKIKMTLALNCWHVCYHWVLLVRSKTLSKITFFWKKTNFFFKNADLENEIFWFWLYKFCRIVKSPTDVAVATFFLEMQFFSKFKFFFEHFRLWLKQFAQFPQLLWKVCQNFLLRVHINHSRRFCLNEKLLNFL